MTIEQKIKKYLTDIADAAYPDLSDAVRKQIHFFEVKFVKKERVSTGGIYYSKRTRKIPCMEIYNLSLGPEYVAKTCIHEMSHHIEFCLYKKTGHQKQFYEIYQKLIYAALDMGLMMKYSFTDVWSRDKNKVQKIVSGWKPKETDYHFPKYIIQVYGGYRQKEKIKEAGYWWNQLTQTWEKETDRSEEEINFLQEIGCKTYECAENSLIIHPVVMFVEATGDTFDKKDLLKAEGFSYDTKTKTWKKKTTTVMLRPYVEKLQEKACFTNVKFKIVG